MRANEVFLFAIEDHLRVALITTSLESIARASLGTQDAKYVFFASEYSVTPGRLMRLFHQLRANGRVVGVALDKIGLSALELWKTVDVIDAQSNSVESTVSLIRNYLGVQPEDRRDSVELNSSKIFISFSSYDVRFKEELTERLKRWSWEWWEFTESERDYQKDIPRELAERICESAAVIFLLTRNWTSSEWCVREYDFAISRKIDAFCLRFEQMDLEAIQKTIFAPQRPFIDFTLSSDNGFRRLGQALDGIRTRKP